MIHLNGELIVKKYSGVFNEQYAKKKDNVLGKIQENIDEGVNEIVNMDQNDAEGVKVKIKTKHDHKKNTWWDNQCKKQSGR